MTFSICMLITWIVIIILSLIPKRLSEIDMVFLFFVNTIFELSIFTIFHVNLKWLNISQEVEKSLADLMFRLIMVPLFFIISTNILLYSWKFLKWIIILAMLVCFILMKDLLKSLGILTTHHWNMMYSILMFCSYLIFSRLMAWFITKAGSKEVDKL
ncbi:MAG: hypothetical protein Q8934_03595 [Bacillota bacterium]|nr:hypothetical protein [Bacillota bacterium]